MRRVNPRTQTPIPATILMFVGGVVLMVALPGDALIELITVGTILPADRLRRDGRALPGRTRAAGSPGGRVLPRAVRAAGRVVALVWLVVAMCVVVLPSQAASSVLVAGGVIVLGALFFVGLLVSNPEAMHTEPGDAEVFEH